MRKIRTTTPPFTVQQVGPVAIISAAGLDLDALGGVLVESRLRESLENYLRANLIDDVVRDTGLSRARVGRLRKSLGIAGTYSGDSKTTEWRKRKNETHSGCNPLRRDKR